MPRRRKKKGAQSDPHAGIKVEKTPREHDRFVDAVGDIDGWGQASEVFDYVTSVRTIFPDFNRATTVGGLPVRRIHTVHGPTHGGKTAFALGLVKSFVDVGHIGGYIDAEHTLGQEFVEETVRELKDKRNFIANRPESYEKTIKAVDTFLAKVSKARETEPGIKSILVIDSINKLVPERELASLLKKETTDYKGKKSGGASELTKGHQGRYRAALNQAWLDHLTPIVARAECAMVIIAQERDEADTTSFVKDDFKVKGGKALMFDASLVIRVSKAAPIYDTGNEKKNDKIVGFAHRVRIWKSKIGHMDGKYSDCAFHLSNGKIAPAGFDMARDSLAIGSKMGIVKTAGAWFSYQGRRQQGINGAIEHMIKHPDRLNDLMNEIAEKIDKDAGRTE